MATIQKFTDLEIWQLANELEKDVYLELIQESLSKDYELRNQMSRSSGSIMDNIAEGFGRGGRLEFKQFLTIAKGSADELQSQLMRCLNRKHFDQPTFERLNRKAEMVGNKIGALIQYLLRTSIQGLKYKSPGDADHLLKEEDVKYLSKMRLESEEQLQDFSMNEITRNKKPETINTTSAAKPLGAYPHARKVGNLLFLSGIGSRQASDNTIPGLRLDETGNIVSYDIEAECHSVFSNVKAVLEASGSSWDKIVDVTVFLTNMKQDFPVYNKVYGEYFEGVEACRTTVEVKSLPTPIAIELKVIAAV